MNRTLCLAVAAVAMLGAWREAGAENTGDPPYEMRLELDLVDGSRVIGVPDIESVPIQTSYAKMNIPLTQITAITMDEDHETASVEMRNGDKLKGVINLKPIKLETVFGKVAVGIEHIRELRVVLLGGAPASGVRLPSPLKWEKASLPWPDRIPAACVVFDGKIWLIGSAQDGEVGVFFNDVWCSADGDQWVKVCSAAPWEPRAGAVALAYDGKLWLVGGCKAHSVMLGDVWSSRNGVDWTPVADNAPWGPRYCAGGVVKDDSMWIIGGSNGKNLCADVWRTRDGKEWTLVTDDAPWGPRAGSVAVFRDRFWILAGRQGSLFAPMRNDVWSSANGREWVIATKSAPWAPRQGAALSACGWRLWLMGGETTGTVWVNDIWWTEDGVAWKQETEHAEWPPQASGRGTFEFNGRLWIVGGTSGYRQYVKGIWRTVGRNGLQRGLIAWYDFDDGTLQDGSGYGNDGIPHGVVPAFDRHGVADSAMYFNGTNAWIEVKSSTLYDDLDAITLALWIRPIDDGRGRIEQNLLSKQPSGWLSTSHGPQTSNHGGLFDLNLYMENGGGQVYFCSQVQPNMTSWGHVARMQPLPADEWRHLAVTVSRMQNRIRVYVNGDKADDVVCPDHLGQLLSQPNREPLRIGKRKDADFGRRFFCGWMDDVRIYDCLLNDEEVASLVSGP